MKASLLEFLEGTKDLKLYLEIANKQKDLLSYKIVDIPKSNESPLQSLVSEYQNHSRTFKKKKIYDYKISIISLYGYFEHYLENIAKDYLNYINKIVDKYENLPTEIFRSHYELSASLINHLMLFSKDDKSSEVIDVINNMYSCVKNRKNFKINVDAYVLHTANFRHEIVNSFFNKVGIKDISDKIKKHSDFIAYLNSRNNSINTVQNKKEHDNEIIFSRINDLCYRRNEIAHGQPISEILSLDLIYELIEYFELYSKCLHSIVLKELIPYDINFKSICLGKPNQVYSNGIISLKLENISLSVGDTIVAKTTKSKTKNRNNDGLDNFQENIKSESYDLGIIESIQINKVSKIKIKINNPINVGLKVNFKNLTPKENHSFYILKNNLFSEYY